MSNTKEEVNQRLLDKYGRMGDLPKYRVCWTDDLVEKRKEMFRDFVPGTNILLREVEEVRLVKKYNYLEPQWILEVLQYNHDQAVLAPDIGRQFLTYEPFYPFGHEDKECKIPKPLVWRAIEFLLDMHLNGPKVKKSPKDITEQEFKELERDEQLMLDMLNEHGDSYFQSALHDGDAIVMPKEFKEDSPLLKEVKQNGN